jgi:hypothetical protein
MSLVQWSYMQHVFLWKFLSYSLQKLLHIILHYMFWQIWSSTGIYGCYLMETVVLQFFIAPIFRYGPVYALVMGHSSYSAVCLLWLATYWETGTTKTEAQQFPLNNNFEHIMMYIFVGKCSVAWHMNLLKVHNFIERYVAHKTFEQVTFSNGYPYLGWRGVFKVQYTILLSQTGA